MDTKKAVLKGVLTMVVVALAGFLLFNGIGRHPYQPDELEGVFRKEAAARSVSGEGEINIRSWNFIPACRERSLRKILFMRRGTTP